MDDLALGALFRIIRLHRAWTQREVAARAGVSDGIVSRIEHGQLGGITRDTLMKVARILEVRLGHEARWRGGEIARLVAGRHSTLVEATAARLRPAGWTVQPEVSFSIWGERGSIDLLAWQPRRRALLVIEVKTEITDVGATLATLDRKRRLAPAIVRELEGWTDRAPITTSSALLIAEGRTNRRVVAAHRETFRAALPHDGRRFRAFVRDPAAPAAPVAALTFLPDQRLGTTKPRLAAVHRVRRPCRPRSDRS